MLFRSLSIAAGHGTYSVGRVQTPTLAMVCERYWDCLLYTSKKDEKDVLIVRDEKTGEISVVAGLDADGFNPGDVVELFDGKTAAHATVKSVLDKVVTLDAPCTLDVADTKVGTAKYIKTCEMISPVFSSRTTSTSFSSFFFAI